MNNGIDPLKTLLRYILLVLAFILGIVGGPVAAQQAMPPDGSESAMPWQVHELISLLEDPTVHDWIERQRATYQQPQTSSVMPLDARDPVFTYTASNLMLIRRHLEALGAALPNLPGEFEQAGSVLMRELRNWGLIDVILLFTCFVLLGVGTEWLFRRATTGIRTRLVESGMETVRQRLHIVAMRFVIGLGLVIAFTLGSVGSFMTFNWPPLLRNVVLGYLMAFLAVRLSLVVGRFLLAPGAERFRIIPLTTPQARFWHFRLALLAGWFAFGRFTIEQLGMLGASLEVRQIVAYVLGFGLLGIALESVWRNPCPRHDLYGHIGVWLFSAGLAGLWLLRVAGIMPVFWLVATAMALPLAINLTQRSVNHILRPPAASEPVADSPSILSICLERGARAALVIGAVVLLSHVWEIDLIALSVVDTLPTRILRGILNAIVILLVADFAWNLVKAAIDRKLTRTFGLNATDEEEARRQSRLRTLLPVVRNVLFITTVVMAGLMALSALGIDTGPLVAGAGVVGVAIGFGAQTLVKDIISGMFYLLDDAFRIGEYIQSGSYKGTVESFSLRSVKLRHHRGPLYTIPFGSLGAVQNMSRDWVIDKLTVSVTYDTDLATVKKIVKRVGAELAADPEFAPQIIETLKMQGVEQFGDFAIQIRMKMMTKPGEQFVIRRRAYALIKTAFDEGGIQFAFPTVRVASNGADTASNIDTAVGHRGLELVKPPPA
jgi:small-conductance mechanosensitive channel